MNDRKFIIITVVLTVALLFGGIFFLTKTTNAPQITASQNAKAYVVDPTSFDWGDIPMYKGNKTKVFAIKNTGTDTLKLFNVRTSCHCTKAYVTIDGNDSPSFGMDNLSAWTGEVLAGKEAKLTVVFDPAFHGPQGMGAVNRFVSVETNDQANSKLTFTLTGAVVK
ncbi:MAG: hypothetical protein A3H17_01680 [Candidatus Levybacteria bacterium RIFCSPLOWO2_12_FULL_37_14]|nr:MAG: hypothetical protein US43_C0001G0015 [Candidatus Levybacteria bacterium GW2011_GWA1_37_16]KKQ38367.1 MAG: hypothetical protein US55_C0008G0012 [Candidatus Levybacteria bacterium GW2011_GWC2_37_7]KKQ42774.1 MAG: hypothetical protein US59_C0004G0014 [Candidatus Levybacteria bacterium GW2011_GWB1_37_8]OGH51107.1 MAG: hypothetical protein A3H17_01680 [Candidatus Levybacteria bacterium RIFCSPLOWO2_12_FULL_37_14]